MSNIMIPFNFQPVSTAGVVGTVSGEDYVVPAGKYARVVCSVMGAGEIKLTPSGEAGKIILRSLAYVAAFDVGDQADTYTYLGITGSPLTYYNVSSTTPSLNVQQGSSGTNTGAAFTFGGGTHRWNSRIKTSGHPGTSSTITIWVASGDTVTAYQGPSGGNADLMVSLYNNQS